MTCDLKSVDQCYEFLTTCRSRSYTGGGRRDASEKSFAKQRMLTPWTCRATAFLSLDTEIQVLAVDNTAANLVSLKEECNKEASKASPRLEDNRPAPSPLIEVRAS
jgi:hypothetical protein